MMIVKSEFIKCPSCHGLNNECEICLDTGVILEIKTPKILTQGQKEELLEMLEGIQVVEVDV